MTNTPKTEILKKMGNPQIYPKLSIARIQNPERLYAIPLLGFLAKLILLIPVYLIILGLEIAIIFLMAVNALKVLFVGRYWETAYQIYSKFMILSAKVTFYMVGLVDQYPGFNLSDDGLFALLVPRNDHPSRLFAVPVLGLVARYVPLIPFLIFSQIVKYAYYLGSAFGASFSVLFTGQYPESVHELVRDGVRLDLATSSYLLGLSDHYPSFAISMNHKAVKILLLILGALLVISQIIGGLLGNHPRYNRYNVPSSSSPGYYAASAH